MADPPGQKLVYACLYRFKLKGQAAIARAISERFGPSVRCSYTAEDMFEITGFPRGDITITAKAVGQVVDRYVDEQLQLTAAECQVAKIPDSTMRDTLSDDDRRDNLQYEFGLLEQPAPPASSGAMDPNGDDPVEVGVAISDIVQLPDAPNVQVAFVRVKDLGHDALRCILAPPKSPFYRASRLAQACVMRCVKYDEGQGKHQDVVLNITPLVSNSTTDMWSYVGAGLIKKKFTPAQSALMEDVTVDTIEGELGQVFLRGTTREDRRRPMRWGEAKGVLARGYDRNTQFGAFNQTLTSFSEEVEAVMGTIGVRHDSPASVEAHWEFEFQKLDGKDVSIIVDAIGGKSPFAITGQTIAALVYLHCPTRVFDGRCSFKSTIHSPLARVEDAKGVVESINIELGLQKQPTVELRDAPGLRLTGIKLKAVVKYHLPGTERGGSAPMSLAITRVYDYIIHRQVVDGQLDKLIFAEAADEGADCWSKRVWYEMSVLPSEAACESIDMKEIAGLGADELVKRMEAMSLDTGMAGLINNMDGVGYFNSGVGLDVEAALLKVAETVAARQSTGGVW